MDYCSFSNGAVAYATYEAVHGLSDGETNYSARLILMSCAAI